MALETPISAWQPPIAAESVAPFLNRLPTSAAVSRKSSTPDSPPSQKQMSYIKTAGITPAAPLVGAVTTRPNAAFSSLTARATQLTQPRISGNPRPPGGPPRSTTPRLPASARPAPAWP